MTGFAVFLYAFLGGIAINFLRLVELAHVPPQQRPATFTDPMYVTQFFVLPLVGGGLAFAYNASNIPLTPILAVNIGVSAPLILKSFASALPPIGTIRTD